MNEEEKAFLISELKRYCLEKSIKTTKEVSYVDIDDWLISVFKSKIDEYIDNVFIEIENEFDLTDSWTGRRLKVTTVEKIDTKSNKEVIMKEDDKEYEQFIEDSFNVQESVATDELLDSFKVAAKEHLKLSDYIKDQLNNEDEKKAFINATLEQPFINYLGAAEIKPEGSKYTGKEEINRVKSLVSSIDCWLIYEEFRRTVFDTPSTYLELKILYDELIESKNESLKNSDMKKYTMEEQKEALLLSKSVVYPIDKTLYDDMVIANNLVKSHADLYNEMLSWWKSYKKKHS